MIRLIGAEVARLRSRTSFWIFGLAALALLATFQLAVNEMVSPPSAEARAVARQAFDEAHQQWQQECAGSSDSGGSTGGDTGGDTSGDRSGDTGGDEPTSDCQDGEPRLSDYVGEPFGFAEAAPSSVRIGTLLAGLLLFLVGASSIGAEYGSGAIGNWLTYVPRRGRVFAAKTVAVVQAALVVGVVFAGVSVAGPALLVTLHGAGTAGLPVVLALAARALVVPVVTGVLGFCLALLTRHTVGALGVVLGYLLVVFVRTVVLGGIDWAQRITPWLPEANLLAIVDRGYRYQLMVAPGPGEDSPGYLERTVGLGHGILYTAVLLAVAITVSAVVFRRRDVS